MSGPGNFSAETTRLIGVLTALMMKATNRQRFIVASMVLATVDATQDDEMAMAMMDVEEAVRRARAVDAANRAATPTPSKENPS